MFQDEYTVVSNTCLGVETLHRFGGEYTNPFMATFILHDNEFVDLSCNYDHYISCKPEFKDPKSGTLWHSQTGRTYYQHQILHWTEQDNYLTMHIGGVEVHWIHAENTKESVQDKYLRRLERGKKLKPIFLCAQLLQLHTPEERALLLKKFLSSKDRTIFLTNKEEEVFEDEMHTCVYIPEWGGIPDTKRAVDNIPEFPGGGILAPSYVAKKVIEHKFLKGDTGLLSCPITNIITVNR